MQSVLAGSHAALMRYLGSETDDELYGETVDSSEEAWSNGRWAEEIDARHY